MELRIEEIRKSYNGNKTYAVKELSLNLTEGVYGLLGPNGAGKSTLMNIITQNLKADCGYVSFDGVKVDKNNKKYREYLGYMPQQQGLYDEFTGEQFLWYMSALKGMKRKAAKKEIDELLTLVNLDGSRYEKIKSYSGGMKQRILIAQALLNNPKILIMDEPTAGLDPKERISIRNFISQISEKKIVLLATHVVTDVEYIAKEIIMLKEGAIIAQGTPQKLLKIMENKVYEVLITKEEHKEYEEKKYKIANISYTEEKICLRIISDEIPKIGQVLSTRPTLEDLYLYFMNE